MLAAFEFSSVVYLVEPTGAVARNLLELREGIRQAEPRSLFYHAYEPLLRDPGADEPPPHDFAHWCEHVLLHPEAAERLEFASVSSGQGLESLREALVSVLDDLCRDDRARREAPLELGLRLHRWHTLAVRSGLAARDAYEMIECVEALDDEGFLFHFHEAAEFSTESAGDLVAWLEESGAERHARVAREVQSSRAGLHAARRSLLRRWRQRSIPARLVAKAGEPEAARRGEARDVMTRLVRGWRRDAEPK
ncbi:MAG: hypothetical protein HZB25_12425 [Candidatus Eisenbacteria bacterium]|nr:hypothetical protein [Candidatus Eisenbacteria bacterium]